MAVEVRGVRTEDEFNAWCDAWCDAIDVGF